MVEFEKAMKSLLKTGKISIGSEKAISLARTGKAKMFIISSNYPEPLKETISEYATLSKIPVFIATLSSNDLKTVCDKPFNVSIVSVQDQGRSEILKLAEKANVKQN